MFSWFKKKHALPSTHDFPRKEYSAYWEIYERGDTCREVRIMGYEGTLHRESTTITASSKELLDNKVAKFLVETMSKYKRA